MLALVGMPGAGKTVCAEHLRRKGYFALRFGAVVVDEVRRRGWDLTPANERIAREDLRETHGMAAMALISLPKLQDALKRHLCIIIDGLYSFSEYKLLVERLGAPVVLVAIAAPRHLRYQRLASRPERPLAAREARERDIQEIESLKRAGLSPWPISRCLTTARPLSCFISLMPYSNRLGLRLDATAPCLSAIYMNPV